MYVDLYVLVGNDSPMLHANGSVHVISFAIFHSQQRLCARNTRHGIFGRVVMKPVREKWVDKLKSHRHDRCTEDKAC